MNEMLLTYWLTHMLTSNMVPVQDNFNQRMMHVVQQLREIYKITSAWTFGCFSYNIIVKVNGKEMCVRRAEVGRFLARPSIVAVATTSFTSHLLPSTSTLNTLLPWAFGSLLPRQLDHDGFDSLYQLIHVSNLKFRREGIHQNIPTWQPFLSPNSQGFCSWIQVAYHRLQLQVGASRSTS